MIRNKKMLQIDRLELNYWFDPRRVVTYIYATECHEDGKFYRYKLLKEESHPAIDDDQGYLLALPGPGFSRCDEVKSFLQKIVDFAYETFGIVPTKYTLELSSQAAHLADMRKIVASELGIDL